MPKKPKLLVVVFALIWATPVFASGPSFHPDTSIDGSSLNGWRTFGSADWRAEKGQIVGTPKQGGTGGWLVLDHSYQDSALYGEYRCTGGCIAGVLFRAEKTSEGGLKGTYVELSDPDLQAYSVTIDAQGQILERSKLRRGGGPSRSRACPRVTAAGCRRTPPRGAACSRPARRGRRRSARPA